MKSNPKLKSDFLARPQPFIFVTDKKDKKSPKKHQLRQPTKRTKKSKNHYKKGLEITKKEASSITGSPPSLDLDLYFSESPNLPGWWR
jgi:hypothetical protein